MSVAAHNQPSGLCRAYRSAYGFKAVEKTIACTVGVLFLWDVVEILDGVAAEKTGCRDSGRLVELLEELYTYSLA